ncbi:MazG nucleotide pyrophosphohydrolase domain-containing protein [Nocardiopsis flavescens]|uniref:MazG nucleotide pyrophosphohydrolase domain-containing protein n=1 Tax=Nocardiopsis flavescens TaxID=758803 RepID=A0A1M6UEE1_9ACTN|nr:MazG nucleotide pyrophosphohydrolase domain-containing protein [Nocardiopsis flavescens]SHK67622.1 MazG nucleotide pyrophosphohydrolase domain-containing protein [Nocardiopsis flavescens]
MEPLPDRPLTLDRIQAYVAEMEVERGFSDCTLVEQALKLAEETGEVCKAVRERASLGLDPTSTVGDLGQELADVLIYLASIANREGIDLSRALREKEAVNETRTWV